MDNNMLMITLRELLVLLMQNRTLPEKSADALRYCREHIADGALPINIYAEYRDMVDHLEELASENRSIAPDDLLRSGGDLMLGILLLYEKLAVENTMNNMTPHGVHYC